MESATEEKGLIFLGSGDLVSRAEGQSRGKREPFREGGVATSFFSRLGEGEGIGPHPALFLPHPEQTPGLWVLPPASSTVQAPETMSFLWTGPLLVWNRERGHRKTLGRLLSNI